jgi:surface protein
MNNGTDYTDIFGDLPNLKYISLINMNINGETNETFSSFNERKELLVCQNNPYISNATEFCCEKNNNSLFCKTDNYITIKYKEDTDYPCGFGINIKCAVIFCGEVDSDFCADFYATLDVALEIFEGNLLYVNRELISFINIKNSSYISSYIPFKIEKNDIIEIHFINPPKNLSNFFNLYGDLGDYKFLSTFIYPVLGDKNIISVDFSHFNSSLVENTAYMFQNASIEEIEFSNFDTSKVSDMSGMFENCTSLKSLNLSKFDTSNVYNMESIFENCTSLKSLNLSNFNTSKVGDMSNMFSGCKSLQYLDISHFSTNSLTSQKI